MNQSTKTIAYHRNFFFPYGVGYHTSQIIEKQPGQSKNQVFEIWDRKGIFAAVKEQYYCFSKNIN
jgi:hypothetical protein